MKMNMDEEMSAEFRHFEMSSLSSTNSSSSGSTSMQTHLAKNQLFLNTAPKILKLSAVGILVLTLAYFIINIFNLVTYLEKHAEIADRV